MSKERSWSFGLGWSLDCQAKDTVGRSCIPVESQYIWYITIARPCAIHGILRNHHKTLQILYKGVINQSQIYFTAGWEQPAHLKSFAIMKLIGWRSPGLNKTYFTVNPSACCTTTAPIINSAINIRAINSQSWWDTYCSSIAVTATLNCRYQIIGSSSKCTRFSWSNTSRKTGSTLRSLSTCTWIHTFTRWKVWKRKIKNITRLSLIYWNQGESISMRLHRKVNNSMWLKMDYFLNQTLSMTCRNWLTPKIPQNYASTSRLLHYQLWWQQSGASFHALRHLQRGPWDGWSFQAHPASQALP